MSFEGLISPSEKGKEKKMNTPLISVIVPVYKTHIDLLQRCLTSITAQTYKNLEVIIVLNGNTSDYNNKVRKTIAGDKIKICEIDRIGPSAARNEGLRLARGTFITFVDADDEIFSTYIENALRIIRKTGADVAVGGLRFQFDGYDRLLCYTGDILSLQGVDVCYRLLTVSDGVRGGINGYLFYSASGKLFRRKILEHVIFNEDVSYYEDMLFMFSVAIQGASFVLSPEIWYTYYQYSHSLLHSKNEKTIHNFPIILNAISNKIIEAHMEDCLYVPFCSFILWCVRFSVQLSDNCSRFVDFINNCKQVSLIINLIDERKSQTNIFTKFCIKHQCYRLYYFAYKARKSIAKLKRIIKTDKLIQVE